MLLVYAPKDSPRLRYTLNLIFQTVLKVNHLLTTDKLKFEQSDCPKMSYGARVSDEIHLAAVELLWQRGIEKQTITVERVANLPVFFQHGERAAALPYDPFAMIFYLVSRYEEYTATEFDAHGRFRAADSLAQQNGFLQLPLVNHLCLQLKSLLNTQFPNFAPTQRFFRFQPTYDIDYAWAFRNRNFWRTLGGYLSDLRRRDFATLKDRIKVQTDRKKDPFFVFDELNYLHQKMNAPNWLSPIYFLLIGNYGKFDKNISHKNPAFRRLVAALALQYPIGLHPSYASNADPKRLATEKNRLEMMTKHPIRRSRQHFLKLHLPQTYQNLLKNGIKSDYTMGYAEAVGFRASIANTYFWYDLTAETATELRVTPFQVMDVTLRDYLKLSPAAALETTQQIIEATRAVNGKFITLWHNSTLDAVWKAVYLEILETV